MASLRSAQARGATPETGQIAIETGLSLACVEARLEDLNGVGWVANTDRLGWVLTIRCEDVSLGQLLQALAVSPLGLRTHGGALGSALADRLEQLASDPLQGSLDELLEEGSGKPQIG